MLKALQILRQRQSVFASQRAAQADAEEAARMAALEKDLETYVADMRASWRQSMTPRAPRVQRRPSAIHRTVAA